MADNKPRYIVTLSNGQAYQFTEDEYKQRESTIFDKDQGARVARINDYSFDDDIDDNAAYTVTSESGDTFLMSGEEYRSRYDKIRGMQGVRVGSLSNVDYWGDKLRAIEDEIRTLEPQRESALAAVNDPSNSWDITSEDADMAQASAAAERSMKANADLKNISARLKTLREQREANPAYQERRNARLKYFADQTSHIDELSAELNEANPNSAKLLANPSMGLQGNDTQLAFDMKQNPAYYRDKEALAAAKMMYADATKTESAPSRYDNSKTGFGNFFRGLAGEAPEALSPIALGKALAEDIPLGSVLKKVQDAEGKNANIVELVTKNPDRLNYLSQAERELLTAFVVKSATDFARSEDLSLGYQAGSSAMKSLGFMADFLMAGGLAGGIEAGAATLAKKLGVKGITNAIARASLNMGLEGTARKAALAVPKFAAGTVKAAAKTLVMTPFMPSSYENFLNNLYRINDAGEVDLSGEAIKDAIGDVFIENLSESAGAQVEAILGAPFRAASSAGIGKLFAGTKFGAWGKAIKNSPLAGVLTKAGWNGLVGEIGEEWYGNALRVMTGVDKDALKDFATVDQQLITLASFAPMSLIGLGSGAAQYAVSKKQVANAGATLAEVLRNNGYDDEQTIKNYLDVTKAENPTQLAEGLAPVVNQAAKDGKDAPAVYQAVMDYAKAVARWRTFDGMSEADAESQRLGMLNSISSQLGQPMYEDEERAMNSLWINRNEKTLADGSVLPVHTVRVLTERETGDEYYVTGQPDEGGLLATMRRSDGRTHYVYPEDMEGFDDTGYMSLNDYLDTELVRRKRLTDTERVKDETKKNREAVIMRAQPETLINLGTTENPVEGIIRQFDGQHFIVETEGKLIPYTVEEIANALDMPLVPMTQEQQEAAAIETQNRYDNLRGRAAAARGVDISSVMNAEQPIPSPATLDNVIMRSDEERPFQVDYIAPDGSHSFVFATEDELAAIIGLAENKPAAQVESEPAQQETPVEDTTPRDFRGTPLPMRTNKHTGQQVVDENALWNRDPEAWARWNDNNPNQRVTSKERLESQITDLNKAIEKDTKAVQNAALKGIDADKMDDMEFELAKKIERRDTLASILNNYNLPTAAGTTAAGEQRKAAAEAVKQEQQAGFPGIQQRWNNAQKIVGAPDEIRLANGETIQGHYVLMDAMAPTPSHDPANGFKMTEGFPVDENGKTVNDRDYEHDKAAQASVLEKAKSYDQRALQTPVIVSADGVVLSGNDRTMASQIAAANNTDGAYTEYLSKYAQKYGFTPEQVSQLQHPRVVFVPDAEMPYNAATFAKFNADDKKSQSKTEKAVKAGKTLTPDALGSIASLVDRYDDINALYNDAAGVDELLNILLTAEVITPEQVAALRDGDRLSGAGMDMLESTLIGASLDEEAVRIAMADPSIRKSVVSAISQIILGNTLADYNLRTELTDAISLVAAGKAAKEIKFGESVQDYIRQQHLFEDNVVAEATVQMLADAINDRKTSFLKKVLSLYNRDAAESAAGQMNILTGDVPTREIILRNILEYLGYDTNRIYTEAARRAEESAEEAQPAGNEPAEEQADSPVQSSEGSRSRVAQFIREEVAAILEQGNVGETGLAEVMTDEEVAEFMRLWDAFLPYNDALGEAYGRLDKQLKSSDKKVKKAAQAEIDQLEQAQNEAFVPVQEYVDSLLEKYDLSTFDSTPVAENAMAEEDAMTEEDAEEMEEEIADEEIEDETEDEEPDPDEPKPTKRKKGSKKSKGKKEEAKPYVVKGGASEATIAKQTYTQEEWEELVYGYSTFGVFESKKTGEQIQIYLIDDAHPIYKDHRCIVSRRMPGPNGKMSENGIYTGQHTETHTTTDYLIKYLKANKFKPVLEERHKKPYKNKYGYWVNTYGHVMNPIRIVLPSVKKGWANFSDTSYYQDDSGKWFADGNASYGTGGGSLGVKRGPYDAKSSAIRATIEALEAFRKSHPGNNTDLRDVDNLIRTLKTKTLPQALMEEGALNNVPRAEINNEDVNNGVQGLLFGEEGETIAAAAPVAKSKTRKKKDAGKYEELRRNIPVKKAADNAAENVEEGCAYQNGSTTYLVTSILNTNEFGVIVEYDILIKATDGSVTYSHSNDSPDGFSKILNDNGFQPADETDDVKKLRKHSEEYWINKAKAEDKKKEKSAKKAASAEETPVEDSEEDAEPKYVLEDEEGTPGNFHWVSERVCTNPIIIAAPGLNKKDSVSKISLAEKDGKWYVASYVVEDSGKGTAWGTQFPSFKSTYTPYSSRYAAVQAAIGSIRWLLENQATKYTNQFGNTWNNTKDLVDYLVRTELPASRKEDNRVSTIIEGLKAFDEAKGRAKFGKAFTNLMKSVGEMLGFADDELNTALKDAAEQFKTEQVRFESLERAKAYYVKRVRNALKEETGNTSMFGYGENSPLVEQEEKPQSDFIKDHIIVAGVLSAKKEEAPAYGSQNTLVTTDQYEELKKKMLAKLNSQLSAGFDPEILAWGAQMAVYHVEAGARKFVDFSQRMIRDLGDGIRPYLQAIYNGARYMPGMEELRKDMDSADDVEAIDVNAISVKEAAAAPVQEEAPVPEESTELPEQTEPAWLNRNNYEIQGFEGLDPAVVYNACDEYIEDVLRETQLNISQVDMIAIGSRAFGMAREDSDLDILLEYEGDVKEDEVFNALNAEPFEIMGIKVDFFPVRAQESGTLYDWLASHDNGRPVEKEQPKAAVKEVNVEGLLGAVSDMYAGKRSEVKLSEFAEERPHHPSFRDDEPISARVKHFKTDFIEKTYKNEDLYVVESNLAGMDDAAYKEVEKSEYNGNGGHGENVNKFYFFDEDSAYNFIYNLWGVKKDELPTKMLFTKPKSAQSSETSGQLVGELGKYTHTKTGKEMAIVRLTGDRLSSDEFKALKARAKEFGGYYSSFGSAKGFLFDSEEDAIKFNTINTTSDVTENTDKQTASGTAIIVSEAASVASKAESLAESTEPAEPAAVNRALRQIDNSLDKIDGQLALLGYYEADKTGPFHESYGYMKSAEKKAVKDADRLAKKLAADLGIEVGRKQLASANIAPAGGDITFRLPLNEGRELYVTIDLAPKLRDERIGGDYMDDLYVGSDIIGRNMAIMFRLENANASGQARYEGSNNFAPYNVTYADLLRRIRSAVRNYLPEAPAETTTSSGPIDVLQVAKEQSEKNAKSRKSSKKSVPSQEDGDAMLGGLFDTLYEAEDNEPEVDDTPAPAQRVKPTEMNGFTKGEKVLYTPNQGKRSGQEQEATIYDFEYDGRPVIDSGLAPILYEVVDWNQIRKIENEPVNTTDDGLQRPDEPSSEGTPAESVQSGSGAQETTGRTGEEAGQEGGGTDSGRTGGSESPVRNSRHRYDDSVKRNTHNNRVSKGEVVYPKTPAARYKANVAAIRLLKELQDSGKKATKEQMAVLRQYTGWGGLGGYFNNEYSPEHRELKSLLTDEEMRAAELSINTAYYTPVEVIDAMWEIAKRLGFEGGNILEGSAGIGNILASMPKNISEHSAISAVELDNITGGILELLYPDANVMIKGFEEADIPNGSVDLAITNVPFGDIQMYDAKEKDLTRKFGGKIHDFCIAKNIRKLADGGIGIFISTRGTLDNSSKALRQWIVNEGNADVIGAFRLNNKTFEGTGATSDIIVVRKRVNGKVSKQAIDVSATEITRRETFETNKTEWNKSTRRYEPVMGEGVMEINSYFVEHPENMGGEMGFGFEHNDSYRPGSSALWPTEKIDQQKRLAKWVKQFQTLEQEQFALNPNASFMEAEESQGTKEGQLVTNSKGEICVSRYGKVVPLNVNVMKVKGYTKAQCLSDYNALKTAINEVLDYQQKNETDEGLKPLLAKLNKAYDTFNRRYGQLNRNTAISFLRNDVDFPAIAAVEDYKEKKDINGKVKIEVKKTGIFNGRVIGAKRVPTPATAKDGVIVSINQFGRIDLPFIAEALKKSEDEVRTEILSSGLGFENPMTKEVEVEYEYLSGNVREKLEYAREHNEGGKYDANIKALEKVIPAEIPAHLIEFSLGSDWLPVSLYTEYAKERFGLNDNFVPQSFGGSWSIREDVNIGDRNEKNRSAGVHSETLNMDKAGHELMLAAMNKSTVQFSKTYKDADGSSHTEHDKEATQAAATKIDEMRDDFKDWCRARILGDNELSDRITKTYNDIFNAIRPKEITDTFVPAHFDGQVLTMGKEGKPFHLYPHQSKAVIRATTEPLMMAHEVGTGKTFTLISTAMEMRRLGTAKKPMIVVQNATLGQFVSSAKALYPNAKVLTITERDRTAEGRAAFYAKIKYNDWDIIIVPQSVFEMIPDSEERKRAFIQEKIDEKKFILEQAKQAKNQAAQRRLTEELKDLEYERDHDGEKRPKKKDAKRAAEAMANAAAKAKKQLDRKTDDVSDFDDMGIDALLIDEAHAYKHLGFSTSMQRGVKGVDPSYSKKSAGLYLKTRSVFDKVGWKNVVFATGTPISNTAAEIWTFMKYLMPDDVMRRLHIYYFDDFVSNFGNISQSLEFTTSGKFKENARFASYTNLPELIRIWSSVTDTVLTKEAVAAKAEDGEVEKLDDKVPVMESWTDDKGEVHENQVRDIYLPQSAALVDIMTAIRARLEWYEGLTGAEKKENSHVPLVMYGLAKMAAIDPRLVDRNAQDEPLSKTNRVVEETLKALEDSKRYKGTAALFCDNFRRWDTDADGKRVEGFNIFEEIKRKLIAAGVPEDQIVIMKSGMTTAAKEKIFAKVNAGEVRVIMGTTATLGTGVNIQERLFFEGHIDAPNRPMDYTQRMGRILRQGNLHKEWGIPVRVVRFGVEDSLDVTAYQRLSTKSKFINSIMDGKPLLANGMENRILEEVEEGEFDNPVAVLSGSQYALLKSAAERELRKLRNKKEQHRQDQIYIERQLKANEYEIGRRKEYIAEDKQFLAKLRERYPNGEVTDIKIEGVKVKGAEQISAAIKSKVFDPLKSLVEVVKRNPNPNRYRTENSQIKTFSFDLNGTQVTVRARVNAWREYDDKTDKTSILSSTEIDYFCPEFGLDGGIGFSAQSVRMSGGLNGVKDVIADFTSRFATGAGVEENIRRNEAAIARMESDNELMLQRRGKPFADEDKLAKQEEIVKDYTKKMRDEMAEKEAKYAEMAKNAKTTFNLDNVTIDDEDEDEDSEDETSAEYSDMDGKGLFSNIPDRQEDEDAMTFTGRVVKAVTDKYPFLKGKIVTVSVANLSPERLAKLSNGKYSYKHKKITIFAREDRDSADGIERTILHEAIHMLIHEFGWNKNRHFINLFNTSLVASHYYELEEYREIFSDVKATYEEKGNRKYTNEEIREEMVTFELSLFLQSGLAGEFIAGAKEFMPELGEQLEKLVNTLGYEPTTESESRMDAEVLQEYREQRIIAAQQRNAERRSVGNSGSESVLRDGAVAGERGREGDVQGTGSEGFDLDENGVSYELVTDPETIQRLERGAKGTGYRNVVQNADGSLGSPMAGKLGRRGERSRATSSFFLNQWERAEENPDMATEDGKINLIKPQGRGNVDGVDYNPYIHIRPTTLNRQFTQAWRRPELVYVETAYPASELESGYKADKAKLSVGRHPWNGGELILSRYDKPTRVVPWDEVADEWTKEYGETGVTFDIVPPELLPILASRGVEILPPKKAAGQPAMDAYNKWRSGVRNRFAYHGTGAEFDAFDSDFAMTGEGTSAHGYGTYLALEPGTAKRYAKFAGNYSMKEAGRAYWKMRDIDEKLESATASDAEREQLEVQKQVLINLEKILSSRIRPKNINADTDLTLEQSWVISDAVATVARWGDVATAIEQSREYLERQSEDSALYKMAEYLTSTTPDDWVSNRYLYTVEIPEDTGENYLSEETEAPASVISRIYNGLQKLAKDKKNTNLAERVQVKQPTIEKIFGSETEKRSGGDLYNGLSLVLGEPKNASDFLRSIGIVGIQYIGRQDGPCVVIFDNKDLRIVNHERFRRAGVDMFISNAEAAVESISMEKATPEQWLKMIESKGGLKAGEDKWIGLSDWLKASDRKTLTKQEVLDYIKENKIQIEEVHYVEDVERDDEMALKSYQDEFKELIESEGNEEAAWQEMVDRYGDDFELAFERFGDTIAPIMDWDDNLTDAAKYFLDKRRETSSERINSTRLHYTTEGLRDKREIALTIPTIEPWNEQDDVHFGDAGSGRAIAWARFGDAFVDEEVVVKPEDKAELERLNKKVHDAFVKAGEEPSDENRDAFLAARDERDLFAGKTDARGGTRRRRVLFIDEIQSKRHQEGREQGYKEISDKERQAAVDARNSAHSKWEQAKKDVNDYLRSIFGENYNVTEGSVPKEYVDAHPLTDEQNMRLAELSYAVKQAEREFDEAQFAVNENLTKQKSDIPVAPFEKNWHELAMKRMLRLAAEEGYDYMVWTTGDQQAERYDIGAVLYGIERKYDRNDYRQYAVNLKNGGQYNILAEQDGSIVYSSKHDFEGRTLSEVFGKEMAAKMMSMSEMDVIKGDNLRIGGEGMRGFYDEILPRFMNKYAKKWGVQVEDKTLYDLGNGPLKVHAIRITPEMKESVMQGQLMFRQGTVSTPSPVSYSESMGARRLAVNETARKCGIEIEFRPSDEMQFQGKPLAGRWINGKMYICLEHCRDLNDAVRTVLHEGVGHNGLRRLIGNENMTDVCLELFRKFPASVRREIATAAVNEYGGDVAEAVEEYLAEKAEVMDFDSEDYERNLWDIVRDALRRVLSLVGINVPLSERDVRWLMWQSYNANKYSDVLNMAKRQVVANKLGFTLRQQAAKGEAVQLSRNKFAEEILAPAARLYNNDVLKMMNRLHETWVDKNNSVHLLVNAIEKATGMPAKAFEDVRLALNQQSSKGLAAIEKFERGYWEPMQKAVRELMAEKNVDLHDVERYTMIKHGLERNEVFAARDAKEYYQNIHDRAVEKIKDADNISPADKDILIAAQDAKLLKHFLAVDNKTDVKYKELRKQDYGGLTALYSEYAPYEPFREGVESEEEFHARVREARHPMYTYIDSEGREQIDMEAMEEAARQEVSEFEAGHEEAVNRMWERINAATKFTLKHQYDANMISREQYKHVSGMFKYYVPLRGFADNTAEDMYEYYNSDQRNSFEPPLLKAKGRTTEAESPFGYIGSMASSAIAADMKNETKLTLYYFVSNRAKNDLVSISEVWYEKDGVDDEGKSIFKPVYPPFNEDLSSEEAKTAYEEWEKGMKEKAKAGLAFKGTRKLNLHNAVIHIDKRQEASHIIKFKVGGRDMMMYINGNPRAAQAINNELNVEMSADYQKVFGKILRWFSGINTSYNPEFWLSNAQRDLLFALMSTDVKEDKAYNDAFRKNLGRLLAHTLTPKAKGGVYSLKRKLDKGELGDSRVETLYKEFVENGGVTGYTTLKNNEEWELELRKYTGERKAAMQAVKNVFDAVQHFGEAIEQMTRFAAYMTSREQGKDIKDAVNDAKELTVNFNRKGSGKAISFKEAERLRTKDGKKLNWLQKAFVVGASWIPVYGRRFIMFFNASTQGLNAMYKLFKKDKKRMAAWTAGYFALGVMQAIMHALIDDDDDYLDIPDYERRNNLLLGGKGVYLKWALPQEARVFYALGDMVVNHALGREPNKGLVGEFLSAASDIAPLNPAGGISALAPSAIVPVVEVALNRDYKGSKIFNDMRYLSDEEKKRTPAYQKAYRGTGKGYVLLSQFANWLTGGDYADAGWLNINPAAVEHIVQGATGGAGTTIGKFYRGTFGQLLGEDFMVRNTPFLSRILTVTDDRYRNAHTTELFDYYKAEAEHTKKRINTYRKNDDGDKLDKLFDSKDYEKMVIYESYRHLMQWYNDELKATTDKDERRSLMREQDAVRKEMINEISNIGNDD